MHLKSNCAATTLSPFGYRVNQNTKSFEVIFQNQKSSIKILKYKK